MSKMLLIQTVASVAACLGIVLTYVCLGNGMRSLAVLGFGVFAVSMLVTPAMRLLPKAAAARL